MDIKYNYSKIKENKLYFSELLGNKWLIKTKKKTLNI